MHRTRNNRVCKAEHVSCVEDGSVVRRRPRTTVSWSVLLVLSLPAVTSHAGRGTMLLGPGVKGIRIGLTRKELHEVCHPDLGLQGLLETGVETIRLAVHPQRSVEVLG